MDEKLQNAGISKMGKSHGGNQATRKGLQRSLLEPVQLDILMGNLEKTGNSEVNNLLMILKHSG